MITLSVLMPGLITEYHKYPAATSENIPFSAFPCAAESAAEDHSRISGLHFPGEKAIMLKAASVKRENTKNCLLLFKNPRIKMTR